MEFIQYINKAILHEKDIIHIDLKPENVLPLRQNNEIRFKIANLAIQSNFFFILSRFICFAKVFFSEVASLLSQLS